MGSGTGQSIGIEASTSPRIFARNNDFARIRANTGIGIGISCKDNSSGAVANVFGAVPTPVQLCTQQGNLALP
jgi:hypothetical protein